MNTVIFEGHVRIVCPECGHYQKIETRAGVVHCAKCKMLIDFDLNMTSISFAALVQEARFALEFRRVS